VFCRRLLSITIPVAIVALNALIAGGCARQPATIVERLAVMPLENLSSDPQSTWFSRASSAVVQYDLAGAKNIFAKPVDSLSAAQSMQASRVLEGYFFERNGRIRIRATVEDFRKTRAVEHFEIEGPVAGGFLPLANELARRLSSGARRFGTNSENAFRFYGEAIGASDAEASERALKSATDADPGFAVSYLDQARLLEGTGARDRALQVIQAGERGTQLDPIDRADLRYVAAAASGDANARIQALETLAQIEPANANLFVDLGQAQFERRNFQAAVRNYQAATLLNPEDPSTWNTLGYALAWTRDLNGARQAIQEYKKMAPEEDTNALDSLGEVSFYLSDFESAAKYFEQAAQKSPPELFKAAEARLMTGDLRAADALVAKYVGPVQGVRPGGREGRAAYRMAQWEFLTGRRAAGLAALETLLPQLDTDEQSLALSQLAIWKLETGDQRAAIDLANQAVAHAKAPQAREMSAVARFVTAGPEAGTVARSGSALVDAYALLFAQKYREALPLLQTAYERTTPSGDGQVRVLLAWARAETDGFAEAGKLLEICPLPFSSGEPMFASLIFPRYFALRAEVFEKQGKMDEVKKNHELYLKYAGSAAN
jgi:tetratricopeptide (TPR) repeat protein